MKKYLLLLCIIVFLFINLISLPNLSVLVIELIFLIYVNHIWKK